MLPQRKILIFNISINRKYLHFKLFRDSNYPNPVPKLKHCYPVTVLKYKLLCPRGTQTCALAVANIAHAVYLLDVAKRPIPQG